MAATAKSLNKPELPTQPPSIKEFLRSKKALIEQALEGTNILWIRDFRFVILPAQWRAPIFCGSTIFDLSFYLHGRRST